MFPAAHSRYGLAGLSLAGLGVLSACAPSGGIVNGDTLGECHRTIQRAVLALQVSGSETTPADRANARDALKQAGHRVLLEWSRYEGLDLHIDDFTHETPQAMAFVRGIDAEAGLSEQARRTELSIAGDQPGRWMEKFNAAMTCADRLAP